MKTLKTYTLKLRQPIYENESPDVKTRSTDVKLIFHDREMFMKWLNEKYINKPCRITSHNVTTKGTIANEQNRILIRFTETRNIDGHIIEMLPVGTLTPEIIIYV